MGVSQDFLICSKDMIDSFTTGYPYMYTRLRKLPPRPDIQSAGSDLLHCSEWFERNLSTNINARPSRLLRGGGECPCNLTSIFVITQIILSFLFYYLWENLPRDISMTPDQGKTTHRPFLFSGKPGISLGDCLEEPVFSREFLPLGRISRKITVASRHAGRKH